MSWNGSGGWNRLYSWVADKASAINITASRFDNEMNDMTANGFGNCLTRDGQGVPSANIPWNSFKITGLNTGTARTDSINLGQVQDGFTNWVTAGGTADAITAAYSPALVALAEGQICYVRAGSANATTTPSFSPSGLTAHTITKFGGNSLAPGDIPGAAYECIFRYNLANTRWEMLNPATSIDWDGHCRLNYTSATAITLAPLRGTTVPLKRNGIWCAYAIPSAGLVAHNTSTYVNGVAGQNLAANTTYYVYLWDNAGSPVLDYSTTGHATDSATGVEVKSGDSTRTLVGVVVTNGSSQFVSTGQNRAVASWFNRQAAFLYGTSAVSGAFGHSGVLTTLNGNLTFTYWQWADEALSFGFAGGVYAGNGTDATLLTLVASIDGANTGFANIVTGNSNVHYVPFSLAGDWNTTEGQHYATIIYDDNSTGGAVSNAWSTGSIRL